MVSEDIQQRRDEYVQVMSDHTTMSRDDIVASVSETQRELFALLTACDEPAATTRPAPDEWSLRDLAMHAAFTELLIAQLVHHLSRGGVPPAEAFDRAGIGMMPVDDGRGWQAVLDDLREANEALLAAIRALTEEPDDEGKLPHPFFGPLTGLEWAGFQRVHDTDHIQHARKIITAVSG